MQDGGHAARDLLTAAGSAQTSLVTATANSATTQELYWCKFISDPLTVSQIDANTWTFALAMAESSANANMNHHGGCMYVLQSNDTVRGFIFDVNSNLGVEFATSEDGQVVTSLNPGLSVTGVVSTDRLVFELWARGTISMAGLYNITAFFDGATDVTGATTTDAAAYIETPQNITFGGGVPVIPLAAAAAISTATVALSARTSITLGSSPAVSTATLALTAQTTVPLAGAAAQSTATLSVTIPAGATPVPLDPAVATSAATLAVTARTAVPLGTAAATATGTLALTAATTVPLTSSAAVSTAALTVTVPVPVPLQTAAAVATATVGITAQTRVPLGSSVAASTGTLALTAATIVLLNPAAAAATGSLTVTIPTTDQFARPMADIAAAGWVVTPLWSKLDEETPSDADLVTGVAS